MVALALTAGSGFGGFRLHRNVDSWFVVNA